MAAASCSAGGYIRSLCGRTAARTAAQLLAVLVLCVLPVQAQARRFVVVLDAAHGGADTGAVLSAAGTAGGQSGDRQTLEKQTLSKQTLEKEMTLAMSQQLRALLVARGFTVVETRENDQLVDADARAVAANRAHADACLTLHATEAGTGVHLFVSSLGQLQPTLLMPWKTVQAGWVQSSLKLSSALHASLTATANGSGSDAEIPVTLGRTSLPAIDSMACPAVAVEVAPWHGGAGSEVVDVTDQDYRTRVLQALAAGLLSWRSEAGQP